MPEASPEPLKPDGHDSFDAYCCAAYPQYFNNILRVSLLVDGGDDEMGGSTRNDNLWGGDGADELQGACQYARCAHARCATKQSNVLASGESTELLGMGSEIDAGDNATNEPQFRLIA